ncbi:MAG: hypothetical protein Q2306_02075 [Phytoplasma sp.]|uniref:hypothetical protein n=1 Tax=Phytoplasma sp. TaxID=2155 RepID=UPI002B412BFE|nr:hypothetical protein [Phytoplasma sp.]WRH06662.1 MAG: hypothetical protein Q2306_02075 [Phytoplasma sp.]
MNFFKNYKEAILVIGFVVICITIGFILSNKEPNQPSETKRETRNLKPKIKITKENFDKIKHYVLSENENEVLSVENLSEEEKTEINKIKQKLVNNMIHSKDYWNPKIKEKQEKSNQLKKQIEEIENKKKSQNLSSREIANLEVDKKMYENMLYGIAGSENYKKDLEKSLNKDLEQNKNNVLSYLNSLYEITSAEE